jgi:hypothetical protein
MMQHTDIFQWANNIDGMKRELEVELFVFNKNYTPYSLPYAAATRDQLKPAFLWGLINDVNHGAGTGLQVKPLEDFDPNSQMITYTELDKVGRADTLIHLIENERNDILQFSQEEHDFKRIQGIVAVYTHPADKSIKFYVIKQLKPADSISNGLAMQIVQGELQMMQPQVVLRMPVDTQMMVVGGEIFIFNESKFVKLFKYDLQTIQETDRRAEILSSHYKISMPENMFDDLGQYIRDKGTNIKKLLDVNLDKMPSQDVLLDIADEMAVDLMTDDAGAIILFDSADVGKLLDLINDNYLKSETGAHYLAKSKKSLDPEE